jgi:hypothetical protein
MLDNMLYEKLKYFRRMVVNMTDFSSQDQFKEAVKLAHRSTQGIFTRGPKSLEHRIIFDNRTGIFLLIHPLRFSEASGFFIDNFQMKIN